MENQNQNTEHKTNYQVTNLSKVKDLKDFELYNYSPGINNDSSKRYFLQGINSVPTYIADFYFKKVFKNIKQENLLEVDTTLIMNNRLFIKFTEVNGDYMFLGDYLTINQKDLEENHWKRIAIIDNLMLAYLKLRYRLKFLVINPDKILINQKLQIMFIETGLFSFLFEHNYYNYNDYNYFNFMFPFHNFSDFSPNFNYSKSNLYSLACIFYYVLSSKIPYNKQIDKSLNDNILLQAHKFDYKSIKDNDVDYFEFFENLPNIGQNNNTNKILKIISESKKNESIVEKIEDEANKILSDEQGYLKKEKNKDDSKYKNFDIELHNPLYNQTDSLFNSNTQIIEYQDFTVYNKVENSKHIPNDISSIILKNQPDSNRSSTEPINIEVVIQDKSLSLDTKTNKLINNDLSNKNQLNNITFNQTNNQANIYSDSMDIKLKEDEPITFDNSKAFKQITKPIRFGNKEKM